MDAMNNLRSNPPESLRNKSTVGLELIYNPETPTGLRDGCKIQSFMVGEVGGELFPVYATRKYKKVANRTYPVKMALPEEYRIVRRPLPDPTIGMQKLLFRPPEFVPGKRYTKE